MLTLPSILAQFVVSEESTASVAFLGVTSVFIAGTATVTMVTATEGTFSFLIFFLIVTILDSPMAAMATGSVTTLAGDPGVGIQLPREGPDGGGTTLEWVFFM